MTVKVRAFRMSDYPMIDENSTIRINLGDDMHANLRKVYNPLGHLQLAAHPTGTIGFLDLVDKHIEWWENETESVDRRVFLLHTVGIEPAYQEQRNAGPLIALWRKARDVARQEGIDAFAVDPHDVDNKRLVPLLEKLGFEYDYDRRYLLKEI